MTALNQSTRRRLQHLPQLPSVWEGDRRRLVSHRDSADWPVAEAEPRPDEDCILWVDGLQGMVRAMDVVTPEIGPEAVARTLLRAMEQPHNPGLPARPKKIVVRDRELLFFLRGVLQDLDITLEYVPNLPLIDEIFRGLQEAIASRTPQLPPPFAAELTTKAEALWQDAPWELLGDHQIIAIEINQWDIGTLYASIMGMLGMEFGVLLYRSLESLRQFRQRAIQENSVEAMQEAFLGQDCLFLTYEADTDTELSPLLPSLSASDALEPVFGNLHPLEGLRTFLYADEAATLTVAIEALHRFLRQHRAKIQNDQFPPIQSRYRIPAPSAKATDIAPPLSVKVYTLPDLAAELLAVDDEEGDWLGADEAKTEAALATVRHDLVPANSFLSLGMIPWEVLEALRQGAEHYQAQGIEAAGEGLPIVMIQTSRPKAKTLIEAIQQAGGLYAICFNPGQNGAGGDRLDLGLLQTGDGQLHLFGEFGAQDPTHIAARKKWEQRCQETHGYCGLIIAKGLTGTSRGNPKLNDMVGLFEARSLSAADLGFGTLSLLSPPG